MIVNFAGSQSINRKAGRAKGEKKKTRVTGVFRENEWEKGRSSVDWGE
jgi:hypothetical protein